MNLLDRAKGALQKMTQTLTTPIAVDGIRPGLMPAALRVVLSVTPAETLAQKRVLFARQFDSGRHDTRLTMRLRQFLGWDETTEFGVRLNFTHKINRALASRLVLEGFSCSDENGRVMAQSAFDGSRLKAKNGALMGELVCDGEAFVVVDYDAVNLRPRFTPVKRFTSPDTVAQRASLFVGDGEGMQIFYPNGDVNRKPFLGAQRWTEETYNVDGIPMRTPRITLYYENRVQRYALVAAGWVLAPLGAGADERPATQWLTDTGTEAGAPLGMPVVHLRTPEMKPATLDAIPVQRALNKIFLDLLSASDAEAHRLILAFGWDAKDPETGMPIQVEPGTIVGTTAQGASAMVVEGGDATRHIQLIDKHVAMMADLSETPLSLINRSNQRAAAGTLQEEKESFLAKVREYATTVETAWEDALKLGVRLHNLYGGAAPIPEDVAWSCSWAPFAARDLAALSAESDALMAVGIPSEFIWRDVWNYDEETIKAMKAAINPQNAVAANAALESDAVPSPDTTLNDNGGTPMSGH